MRRFLLVTALIAALSTYAKINAIDTEVQIGTGFRSDSLNWSIAGPFSTPNILSELSWSDVHSVQLTAQARVFTDCGLYLRGNGDIGWIYEGEGHDSDFDGNNLTQEWSRSYSEADCGTVYDVTAGIGYARKMCWDTLILVPLVGYSVHGQNFHDRNGVSVLEEILTEVNGVPVVEVIPVNRPINGLRSTYKTVWNGPWIGFDIFWNPCFCPAVSLWGSFEYHRAWYDGRGDWNLRDTFLEDFRHNAWANGFVYRGGIDYELGCDWTIGAAFSLQEWRSDHGIDRTTVGIEELDGSDHVIGIIPYTYKGRLNGVNWHSWSGSLTVSKWF